MKTKVSDLCCQVCGSREGRFTIEEEELVLDYKCGHEISGLVFNLDYIGEEDTEVYH